MNDAILDAVRGSRGANTTQSGTFVLVNVHDVGSDALARAADAQAVGTAGGGHADTIARRDAGATQPDRSCAPRNARRHRERCPAQH